MPVIDGVSLPFIPAGGVGELKKSPVTTMRQPGVQSPFEEIFQTELNKLKFSAHAQSRLVSRDISLSEHELKRLESAIESAGKKGGNESLILMDDNAFIVNVANKTVITVVNRQEQEERVITNIDSAVIA